MTPLVPPTTPDRTLRLGVTGMSRLPAQRVLADSARAESDGADLVLWPDHLMAWHADSLWTSEFTPLAEHQDSPHEYLNVVACLAAAAGATSRVRLGSGVTDVARCHPAVLAQQYLTLHHLSGGRCIFGLGAGEGENLTPYGIRMDTPVARLEEAVCIIRLLWESTGPVDRPSPFWPLRGAVLGLGPADGGFPPIWIAGTGPRMLRVAGQQGDGWLPMLMTPAKYASRLATIARHRAQAQVDRPFEPALWTYVCYGTSRDDCLRLFDSPMYKSLALLLPPEEFLELGIEHPLGRSGLGEFIPTWLERQELLDLLDQVPVEAVRKAILHGSVDEISEDLEALARAGAKTVVLANVSFLTSPDRVGPSFRAQRQLLNLYRQTAAASADSRAT